YALTADMFFFVLAFLILFDVFKTAVLSAKSGRKYTKSFHFHKSN
ncbi:MAG: hypothetical protein ACI9AV_001546, partial [Sediminicola sp.]